MESANDMKAAKRTFEGFVALIKWSVPAIAIIALLVVIAISN
jgi:hypothetical protein